VCLVTFEKTVKNSNFFFAKFEFKSEISVKKLKSVKERKNNSVLSHPLEHLMLINDGKC
jgi:hypothetical protein